MTVINGRIFDPADFQELGWTLVHFLWIAALLWIVWRCTMRLLRAQSPQARYLVGCVVLLAMAAALGLTYWTLAGRFDDPGPLIIDAGAALSRLDQLARVLQRAFPPIILCWLVAIAVLAVRPLAGWFWLRHLIRRCAVQGGAEQERLQSLVERSPLLGQRKVRVVCSTLVSSPAVLGLRKPILLAPTDATAVLGPEGVDAVIAHELAHVRRQDYLVNLLQTCIDSLLGWHPSVRVVSKSVRIERELCCDQSAVTVAGRETYTQALGTLATAAPERKMPRIEIAQQALGEPGSALYRINYLLGVRPDTLQGPGIAPLASLLSGLVICLVAARLLAGSVSMTPRRGIADVQSLAAHVYGVLGVPSSTATVLPELASAITHSDRVGAISDPAIEQALVHRLVTGTEPDELVRVIVPRVSVSGLLRFESEAGWPYGTATQRMLIAQKLLVRAKEIHSTDVSRARDYARAALLLSAQESFVFGSAPLSHVLDDPEFTQLAGLAGWQMAQLRRHIADHELITRIATALRVEATDLVCRCRSPGVRADDMHTLRQKALEKISTIVALAGKRPDLRWRAAVLWLQSDPQRLGDASEERRQLVSKAGDEDAAFNRWLEESSPSLGSPPPPPEAIQRVTSASLHRSRRQRD